MVDYTVPDVVHEMAELYMRHRTPFVMGTTGGDRAKLAADVAASGVYAVIAPQMGKQAC
jgi:4-hydroxy-tetrahydrodipicolinate reductase